MHFKNPYSFHTNTNTYFEYPYSAIRNEYHWSGISIPIRFLITPIRLKPNHSALTLTAVAKIQEEVVVGFLNFAWAPN